MTEKAFTPGAEKTTLQLTKKETTMTNLNDDYKALHGAAIATATRMMATLPDDQLQAMADMTQQGAKLLIQIELPDCKEVALVLREIEGKTWPVCKAVRPS